ncbi:hypothetical protein PFISCL1PPCAC_17047, partial [Pristionchus fissidentatus]
TIHSWSILWCAMKICTLYGRRIYFFLVIYSPMVFKSEELFHLYKMVQQRPQCLTLKIHNLHILETQKFAQELMGVDPRLITDESGKVERKTSLRHSEVFITNRKCHTLALSEKGVLTLIKRERKDGGICTFLISFVR